MRLRLRRELAPALFILSALPAVGLAPSAHATVLPRLAVYLDLSQIASSVVAGSGATTMIDEMMLAVPARTTLPETVELSGPTTEVRIGLPHEADMNVEVSNEAGDVVCSARIHMPAGWQKVAFSGHGPGGKPLPNGVYFYKVTVDSDVLVTRVVIAR